MLDEFLEELITRIGCAPEEEGPDRDAYGALFEGTLAGVHIPLWESSRAGEKDVLLSAVTLEVFSAYLEEDLRPKPGQPADYIVYEAAFVQILLRRGKVQKAASFFAAHLSPLARGVLRDVQMAGVSDRYADWAGEMLQRLALLDQDFDGGVVRAQEKEEAWFLPVSPKEKEQLLQKRTVLSCGRGNCGGKCQIPVVVQGGCVLSIGSDYTQGLPKPCLRGRAYRQTFLSDRRLRYPMLRTGKRGEGRFKRISWTRAMDVLEGKLRQITDKYGYGARYVMYATGNSSVLRGDQLVKRLLSLQGGYLAHYNSYSAACAEIAIPYTFGTLEVNSPTLSFKASKMLILWGFNPLVTKHNPLVYKLLKWHRKKKTPVVVIDPHYSETAAAFATEHIPIIPGTDTALASALAFVLWEEGLADQAFMDRYCLGFDPSSMPPGYEGEESYRDYIFGRRDQVPKTPEWAAPITGVAPETIRKLARSMGRMKPVGILSGLGPQRRSYGEQFVRAMAALSCMLGNPGVAGGGCGVDGEYVRHAPPAIPKAKNPYGRSIPVFLWTEAVRRGTSMTEVKDHVRGGAPESDVKLIFNLAGNTLINQHSDVNSTADLLRDEEKCAFIVASDLFMTPSARYADLLLPATSLFESEAIAASWSEGDYLLHADRAVDPLFEGRDEAEWLMELADRLQVPDFAQGCKTPREWLVKIYDQARERDEELPAYEDFARQGGYVYKEKMEKVPFSERFTQQDFRFPTPSGKVEIFCPAIADLSEPESPPIPKYLPEYSSCSDTERGLYPLQLLGWHTKRRTHSIHDQNKRLEKAEPQRLWMHPKDADRRGILDEEEVLVYNARGRIRIRTHLSETIREGVVCIPQGGWYTPDEEGTDRRGCVNVLTDPTPTPLAKGNPQHSALVDVKKIL